MREIALSPINRRPKLDFAHRPGNDSGSSSGTPVRVLLVEDDYLVAMEVEHQLAQAGFEVTGVATSADEAVAMSKSQKPDLAIMDIRLIGTRDGVDAAIELARDFGIRSVFATAHSDARTRERAAVANPLGWLQKPYSANELVSLIKSIRVRE